MGQSQSGSGGSGGDKKDGQDKKKKYEPPVPTRVGKKKRRIKGPDAALKLPQVIQVSKLKYMFFVIWNQTLQNVQIQICRLFNIQMFKNYKKDKLRNIFCFCTIVYLQQLVAILKYMIKPNFFPGYSSH